MGAILLIYSNKIENDIKDLLKDYDKDIQDYLFGDNIETQDGTRMDIVESIKNLLERSLGDAPARETFVNLNTTSDFEQTDTLYCGDIHAQLDLFLQNLYVAGVIDKSGCLRDDFNKTLIQLGDTINKGTFEWETLVFLRVLKKQAQKKGIDFHYIAGNQEINTIYKDANDQSHFLMSKMLKQDIMTKTLKLSYGHPEINLISCHSSIEKSVLVRILVEMAEDIEYSNKLGAKKDELKTIKTLLDRKNNMGISEKDMKVIKEKTSSKNIYSTIFGADITFLDISNWMNKKLQEVVCSGKLGKNNPYAWLFIDDSSVVKSRKKALNKNHPERELNPNEFLIRNKEDKYRYKPIQISGHKQTIYGVKQAYGIRGGIMQSKANIFADTGLVAFYGGYQGFVAMNSSTGFSFAIELRSKDMEKISGLNEKHEPISLTKKTDNWKIRRLEGIRLHNVQNGGRYCVLDL